MDLFLTFLVVKLMNENTETILVNKIIYIKLQYFYVSFIFLANIKLNIHKIFFIYQNNINLIILKKYFEKKYINRKLLYILCSGRFAC